MDTPRVGIIMGSVSDWDTMRHAADMLDQLGIAYEKRVVSAHRTPNLLFEYAESAAGRGLKCIMPGRCAAPPVPAMMHFRPRPSALSAYSKSKLGVRCAKTTRFS